MAEGATPPGRGVEALPERESLACARRSGLSKSDWLFLVGAIVVLGGGWATYHSWDVIASQYEKRVHPQRYWAREVGRQRLGVKLAELDHQDCMVDLLATRMKESIRKEREQLYGISASSARASAVDDTAIQKTRCDALADGLKRDRDHLAAAEWEADEAEESYRISTGSLARESPSFATAWRRASPAWAEIEAAPKYQALDDAGKESVRLSYWRDVISPLVPTDELRRARRQFEQLTAGARKH